MKVEVEVGVHDIRSRFSLRQYPFRARSQNIFLKNLMLCWENNENDAVFDEIFKKKAKIKINFQKNEGYFSEQHPLVEKSPTATDIYIYVYLIKRIRFLDRLLCSCVTLNRNIKMIFFYYCFYRYHLYNYTFLIFTPLFCLRSNS